MKKPHEGFMPPGVPGQTKTMFYSEGNPEALLVTETAGKHSQQPMTFVTAEAALVWCRQNCSNLFYMPVNLSHG